MLNELKSGKKKISVIGLGYVGLPLALEFSKHMHVVGYDINEKLISSLKNGIDPNNEVFDFSAENHNILFTSEENDLNDISVFIVAVSTPVTKLKSPDLRPLKAASAIIGRRLEKGAVVIYESTVYPGCTEEDCLPEIKNNTKLTYLSEYNIAYSPERINPGDKVHTLTNTIKVVAGDTEECQEFVSNLYSVIIKAGIHLAPSIKVAEASKIVENTQRDVNIALMNELSIIFDKMNLNTHEILDAARTKWNFLNFYPGLVGGHCVGVDPYYLTYKATTLGYNPEIILSGRKVNDNLSKHVVKKILNYLETTNKDFIDSKVLVLGITFKENVSDTRNSKVIDVVEELQNYNVKVDVYDPHVDEVQLKAEHNLDLIHSFGSGYDCILAAVAHEEFIQLGIVKIAKLGSPEFLFVDIKGVFRNYKLQLENYWSL